MKKILMVVLCLTFLTGIVFAKEMIPGDNKKPVNLPQGVRLTPNRDVPAFTFTKLPTPLLTSYYDYMIGSYNGLPLRVIPTAAGGGYFMSYHGRRTATGTRRAFYAHLDPAGNMLNNSEITASNAAEGYTTVAVDPVSGKPFYAWHANMDADAQYEVPLTSDAFLGGLSGLFNDMVLIEDGPVTITPSNAAATSDNEFIWPTAQIGPSPVAGKRRVYVIMRNSVTHTYGPSENPYIRFADFNADDIENGTPLNWNTANFTIPEMDDWNHDDEWRRPFHALTCDDAGNIYYAGYHFATQADGTTNIDEADLDIFKCGNYGEGTWTRVSAYSNLATWNPDTSATNTTGYFADDGGVAYADNELYWALMNSSHINATVDDNGKIHVAGIWGLNNADGYYYPALQFMKEFVYDPATSQFSIKEVYPQVDPANTNDTTFQPWDLEAPWGVVDEFGGDATSGYYPLMASDWDFPYWDSTVHSDAMMFHYNNVKVTESNGSGMMAIVWQNAQRARWANEYADPDYSAYANTPEICISVSPDNGGTWSEPIVLNNVDTPQFSGLKPMWVYPADKVIRVDDQNGHKVGKLGFMFYDDYTWGSNAITPPVHPTADGGQVMFMEMEIVFPIGGGANEDETTAPAVSRLQQNFPNPFNPETTISFDLPKALDTDLAIYNVKGQLVKTLFSGTAQKGRTSVTWDGTDNSGAKVTSGIYFYRLNNGDKVETRKMMLMK